MPVTKKKKKKVKAKETAKVAPKKQEEPFADDLLGLIAGQGVQTETPVASKKDEKLRVRFEGTEDVQDPNDPDGLLEVNLVERWAEASAAEKDAKSAKDRYAEQILNGYQILDDEGEVEVSVEGVKALRVALCRQRKTYDNSVKVDGGDKTVLLITKKAGGAVSNNPLADKKRIVELLEKGWDDYIDVKTDLVVNGSITVSALRPLANALNAAKGVDVESLQQIADKTKDGPVKDALQVALEVAKSGLTFGDLLKSRTTFAPTAKYQEKKTMDPAFEEKADTLEAEGIIKKGSAYLKA